MNDRVGKYEVLGRLTEGGMAQLFLGCTRGPGGFRKYVVIKRVLPDTEGDHHLERMFLDEARITAAFSHQGIAQVFDLGEDAGGLYVVMEFVAGQNLSQVIRACAEQQQVLPLSFSLSVVVDVAQALHYAHTFRSPSGAEHGVVHRDVAPKNIMVGFDGQVKLLDFGIAKVKNAIGRTKAGTVKGTAGYMAPEQVRAEPVDARSDVFSLGIVAWEMVTGRRLFSAESELEELRLILEAPIIAPAEAEPSVSEELSGVIMRAVDRRREERFATARDFGRALQAAAEGHIDDADARAAFMRRRFGATILATQRLFDVATSEQAGEVEAAVKAYQSAQRSALVAPRAERARSQVSGSRLEGVRRPRAVSRRALAPVDGPPAAREASAAEPSVAERDTTERPRASPGRGAPWAAIVTLVVAVGVIAGVVVATPVEDTPVSPPDEPRPIELFPAPAPPPPVAPPVAAEALPAPSAPPGAPPVSPPARPGRQAAGKGEVTLVLLPTAKVSLKGTVLGNGSLLSFTLPAGTHLLDVEGPDGTPRRLSLPVTAGKRVQMKLKVDELPARK